MACEPLHGHISSNLCDDFYAFCFYSCILLGAHLHASHLTHLHTLYRICQVTGLLETISDLFSFACWGKKKKKATRGSAEMDFVHKEGGAYVRFSIYLDQLISHGIVATMNVDVIDRLAKGRSIP
jgi:hypothetical protein